MSLRKFDELTEEEQKKVTLMYSNRDTVQMYLYNFDENGNYHGRQYHPPMVVFMEEQKEKIRDLVKDEPKEEVKGKTEPVKKATRKPKKK